MHDLAVVITALNEAHWLRGLLPTLERAAAGLDLDAVVADIESTDGTEALLREEFPSVRRVPVVNRGFAHANNVAQLTCDARYVLFLNPDTEVVSGTFAELLVALDARPEVGLAGVRQLTGDGELYPTMRRFATAGRALAEALGSERLAPRLGQRVLELERYESESECDWTIGSFMLARREALESAGCMDERFFFTAEEQDLCLRIRQAGWGIRHLPTMTIVHHVGKRGIRPRFAAQNAYADVQYARKHFGPARRGAYLAALSLNHGLRALPGGGEDRRAAARAALRRTFAGAGPPFQPPPATALRPGTAAAARAGEPV